MKSCGGDQSGVSLKIKKPLKSEVVIRDVCEKCNSGELAYLDSYFKELYETNNLLVCNHTKNTIIFKYNYSVLLRWLLKTLYNSYRANYDHQGFYKEYINYIMNKGNINSKDKIYIIVELIYINTDNGFHDQFSTFIFDEKELNIGLTFSSMKVGSLYFYMPIFNSEIKNRYRKKFIKKFIKLNGGNMHILTERDNKVEINKITKSLNEIINLRIPKIS